MTRTWPAWFVIALWLVGPAVTVRAVSPLVTDDADTVPPGQLQINSDFQFVRTNSTSFYLVPINPVLGLTPRLELGAIFGYQWRDGSGSFPTSDDADDLTDLTIAPKLRLWQGLEDKLKFSARMDLKVPTASDLHGLGTGNWDVGVVEIATYTIGKTSLDFNAGYYAIDISRADFDDDRWFVGQTIRQTLNEKWTLLAEVFAFLPNTRAGGYANWYFSGGPQWSVRKNVSSSALVGTAAGHKSPDLTGTVEITLTF